MCITLLCKAATNVRFIREMADHRDLQTCAHVTSEINTSNYQLRVMHKDIRKISTVRTQLSLFGSTPYLCKHLTSTYKITEKVIAIMDDWQLDGVNAECFPKPNFLHYF